MTPAAARLKQIASSVAVQNLCAFYAKSSLSDFIAITSRPFRQTKCGSPTYSLALYSIVQQTRHARTMAILWANNDISQPWPQHDWSMQSDMVGRNSEAFRDEIEPQEAKHYFHEIEGWWPVGARRNGWEEVDGDWIGDSWHAIVIEIVY